jgi:hypothetical protein
MAAREAYFLEMASDLAGVAFALMKNQSEYQPNSRLQVPLLHRISHRGCPLLMKSVFHPYHCGRACSR